ncbi:pyridoxamine 5'-phosphate oxidase family protein [Sphaerisporangium sp. TRM90804]|uniref:pyridoxamine 5'-phosphate oxidase family protein n=1 Tax=Sphaerisporangium sp. TRM90804 TaxID=3031113 RepID=UPI002446EDF8|nr:pyridoxamine 5'-phosphate oxidase family protein [Sphaerisporangium sp. TRM90804]MDH2425378.1 pyridoxamine 5'-phosphate oxidase family protein [Sphaerisporangium sp. TRM90804]
MSETANTTAHLEELGEEECLALISPGGIGRVAFGGAPGPTVLPVNYRVLDGAIVFRTRTGGAMDEDLRSGIRGLDIKIAFEVDDIDAAEHRGWSVLIQGPAHHMSKDEVAALPGSAAHPWAGGDRDHYVRIIPMRITGRRITAL